MNKLTGQCLCGKVAYQINAPLGPIVNCHCQKCRRWHGAAFRTRSAVRRQDFSWTRGEEHLSSYYSSEYVQRTFCANCGSNLVNFYDNNPDTVGVPIGGLDQDPSDRPLMNIFVADKSPWYEICDGLPQYDGWPPDGPNAVRVNPTKKD